MGEIADGMISGEFDSVTGEYIGEPCGYPRTYEPGRPDSIKRKPDKNMFTGYKNSTKEMNGVAKFLHMNKIKKYDAINIVRDFCEQELHFAGTLKECCEEIQKDFGKFVQHVKQLNN